MTKEKTHRRAERIQQLINWYPPYWDEGIFYHRSKGVFRWKRKQIMSNQVREYRSWKYNRKTQHK